MCLYNTGDTNLVSGTYEEDLKLNFDHLYTKTRFLPFICFTFNKQTLIKHIYREHFAKKKYNRITIRISTTSKVSFYEMWQRATSNVLLCAAGHIYFFKTHIQTAQQAIIYKEIVLTIFYFFQESTFRWKHRNVSHKYKNVKFFWS